MRRAVHFLGWWLAYAVGLALAWLAGVVMLALTLAYPTEAVAVYLFGGFGAWLAWQRVKR